MEIRNLHLAALRSEEHYMFHLDFTDLVQLFTPVALNIVPLFTAYLPLLEKEKTALDVVRGNVLTHDLAEADTQRDIIFSGLAGTVKSALNHFNPDVRNAAERLKLVFDVYENIALKPYDQETAAIYKLVDDLKNAYLGDATFLGIVGWVDELLTRNIAFETIKNSRYAEEATKPQQDLKLTRVETDQAYRAIVKRINALIEVNGEAVYAAFVHELNQRIENYTNVLAQRQGRNANAASTTTTNNQPINPVS